MALAGQRSIRQARSQLRLLLSISLRDIMIHGSGSVARSDKILTMCSSQRRESAASLTFIDQRFDSCGQWTVRYGRDLIGWICHGLVGATFLSRPVGAR